MVADSHREPDSAPGRPGRSLTVAIPALNEERNIEKTIRAVLASTAKVPDVLLEILVLDDGSTDRTGEIVDDLARRHECLRLVRNPGNLGLGATIRRAIDVASSDKILFVPGDNDIPPATLDLLISSAYVAEIVMCYFHNDESRGRLRFIISTFFRLVYATCFDLYLQYINGPAVYPLAKLRTLELCSTRFSIVAEINVRLLRQGVTFVEVPGNRQVGLEGSTSLSVRSLIEAVRVFFQLLVDVYIRHRDKYARRPVRVPYALSLRPATRDLS